MTEDDPARPPRLGDRLKRLDEAQPEMPEFDLDAVIRGGERQVRRRTVASTAALTAGAGLALAAVFTGALSGSFWAEEETTPEPTPPPASVDLVYTQHDDSVNVYQGEDPLARVTIETAQLSPHGFAIIQVTVDSDAAFTLNPADFVWATDGRDREPRQTGREITVEGFERLTWAYEEVSKGQLVWVPPGADQPVAAWGIDSRSDENQPAAVPSDQVWHLQRDNTVTVFEGMQAQAKVTVSALAVHGETGTAHISLTARGRYALRSDDFVWSSEDGTEHAPVESSWKSLAVEGAWGI